MNTPPTSAGSGVQAPDGYKTNTGTMSSSGRTISTKAEDVKGEVDEVKPAKTQAAEFGTHPDHQAFQKDYSAAFDQLGAGAVAMCDNLVAFAQNLGGTATNYAQHETGAANTVTSAGSGT
ncbi:WXG100 family type VII secretion target [Actinophytocola sp.]|uniref:WXG100 family type VII secretion target n=1 Tax=Actinophytocola sp. TaxID=1872138 RepID=UPI00389B3070